MKMYKLSDMMNRKGVKVKDLALSTGRSVSTISGYKNGNIDPPYSALQDIAKSLGCSITEIVEDKE